jgi:signal transduction histidine kinase
MRRLFSKIFLSFWLSHMMAVGLAYAVFTAAQSQRDEADRRGSPTSLPTEVLLNHAREATLLYKTNASAPEKAALQKHFERVQKKSGLRVALFDARGHLVSGGTALWEWRARRGRSKAPELVERALRSGEAEFASSREGLTGARRFRSSDGGLFVLVAQAPRGRGGPRGNSTAFNIGRQQTFEAARLFSVLVAAGLVSFGLARYLAAPAVTLRRATRQLASGDLSTRVGPQMGRRRDELADLSRDFDLMAERIEGLVKAQNRLLGDISHELRSPLARLKLASELAQRNIEEEGATADAAKREQTLGFLARIEREAARMDALIGQLLTLTRLESGDIKASSVPVSLAGLVEEVRSDAAFEARARGCEVRLTRADECPVVGVPDLLRSAVENVLRNAVRYTGEGTAVEVSVSCEPTSAKPTSEKKEPSFEAVVRVRDYGPGVPEESLGQLFRPFYRVAEARDRQSGGVGLGLSIAERAVRSHGGRMVATNAPGGGLEVEIRLPASKASAA